MACYHPMTGYRAPGGKIQLDRPGAFIDLPITIACGQCRGCRLEKSRQWAIRAVNEAQMHDRNSFITLTYDDKHLPEDRSLVLRHWQLFAKKLRKNVGPFRFMMCGEYGEETLRPHYHALIFGLDFLLDSELYEEEPNVLYTSETLTKTWGKGMAIIGQLNFESAAYVARYTFKKKSGEMAEWWYGKKPLIVAGEGGTVHAAWQVRREIEFNTMSRNKGIGSTWLEKYGRDVYPRDEIVIRGRRMRPPKFYDEQIERVNPAMMRQIKIMRGEAGKRHQENNTTERLQVRENIQRRKEMDEGMRNKI